MSKKLSEKIRYEYGTLKCYARKKNLNYGVLRAVINGCGKSKKVENQLIKDGFLKENESKG